MSRHQTIKVHPDIDNKIDIGSGPDITETSFYLVKQNKLASNQNPTRTQMRSDSH